MAPRGELANDSLPWAPASCSAIWSGQSLLLRKCAVPSFEFTDLLIDSGHTRGLSFLEIFWIGVCSIDKHHSAHRSRSGYY